MALPRASHETSFQTYALKQPKRTAAPMKLHSKLSKLSKTLESSFLAVSSPISDIQHALRTEPGGSVHGERANFAVLVLFCIDASDSESRRIFQQFSRSKDFRSFAPLRIQNFNKNLPKDLHIFTEFLQNFVQILLDFNEISPYFHKNFTERTPSSAEFRK